MPKRRPHQSIITRLAIWMTVLGALISIGLGILEYRRAQTIIQATLTHQLRQAARELQILSCKLLPNGDTQIIRHSIHYVLDDLSVIALRIRVQGQAAIEFGAWEQEQNGRNLPLATLAEDDLNFKHNINLNEKTMVQAPFKYEDTYATLEMIIDGPKALVPAQKRIVQETINHVLLLAIGLLLALMLLRRWFIIPIAEVSAMVSDAASPEAFRRVANQHNCELGRLADSLADMLERLNNTTSELRQRERAFQNLYQFAPTAMISINAKGQITDANRRAAELLGKASEEDMLGKDALDYVESQDRALLRQTIDRLDIESASRCELRTRHASGTRTVTVECAGVRDDEGVLQSVRLSLVDVSEMRRLHKEIEDQERLLNLVVNHMSDGILLIDSDGRIAACNHQMGTLLRARPQSMIGRDYDAEEFWQALNVKDPETFASRLKQIESDENLAAQEQVDSHGGTFLFQGVPVKDAISQSVGRLWVVQEITSQVENQELVEQQTFQLQALRQLGQQLFHIDTVDELLMHAGKHLYEIFGVEAIGVALRHDGPQGRSRQIVNCGTNSLLFDPMQALVRSIEHHLMPQILSRKEVTLWPDLPAGNSWVKPFRSGGFTCVAGAPLIGSSDAQGMIWIARKGGENLDVQHIYLLEALAPLIAARLEIAELNQHLTNLKQMDPITQLPNQDHVRNEMKRLENRPGHAWSFIALKLDHFAKVNEQITHLQANDLLMQMGIKLRQITRKSCFVGRLDGPTFAVICPNLAINHAAAVAERLRQMINEFKPDGFELDTPLTASVGVSSDKDAENNADAVLDAAMSRVEMARQNGHNCVESGPLRLSNRQAS